MQPHVQTYLTGATVLVAVFYTLMGPDHYVPILAMGRARRWSLARTLAITLICRLRHVIGAVLLGCIGIVVGATMGRIQISDGIRSELASWLLIAFGFAYATWGATEAWRNRHPHPHSVVMAHSQLNDHTGRRESVITSWTLFLILALGPCEPLLALLIYPASAQDWYGVMLMLAIFALATLIAIAFAVLVGHACLNRLRRAFIERYANTAARPAVASCGLLVKAGW